MEETRVRSVAIAVICLMLGMVVKDSTAYDKQKYESCFSRCCLDSFQPPFSCSFKCIKKGMKSVTNNRSFSGDESTEIAYRNCELQCAKARCSQLSTKQHPNGDRVGACMDRCGERCLN